MGFCRVKVFAPASIANFGCGFDTFACAIDGLGDTVTVETHGGKLRSGQIVAELQGVSGKKRHLDLSKQNVVLPAILCALTSSCTVRVKKGIPVARGLGSSSASAVAAAYAANLLEYGKVDLDDPTTVHNIITHSAYAESRIGNGVIADNAAASLMGGFVSVSRIGSFYRCLHVPTPSRWRLAIVAPEFALRTAVARAAVESAALDWRAVAQNDDRVRLLLGFTRPDIAMAGEAMSSGVIDRIRFKAGLIQNSGQVIMAARSAGAAGTCIAGAGPSLVALCEDEDCAQKVGDAMVHAWRSHRVKSTKYISRIGAPGARVVGAE